MEESQHLIPRAKQITKESTRGPAKQKRAAWFQNNARVLLHTVCPTEALRREFYHSRS